MILCGDRVTKWPNGKREQGSHRAGLWAHTRNMSGKRPWSSTVSLKCQFDNKMSDVADASPEANCQSFTRSTLHSKTLTHQSLLLHHIAT